MSFKKLGRYFRRKRSLMDNSSERPKKLGNGTDKWKRLALLNRRKRDYSSVAYSENGKAEAGTITYDERNANARAETHDGEAIAKSYAKGQGKSEAKATALDDGDATAIAKAKRSNSSAKAMSLGDGDALAASETEGEGHATAEAKASDAGTGTAVIQIEEGSGVATAMLMSEDPELGNNAESVGTNGNEASDETKARPNQMKDFEESKEIFDDTFMKTGQVKRAKKRRRKKGRKREKKFRTARIVLR